MKKKIKRPSLSLAYKPSTVFWAIYTTRHLDFVTIDQKNINT